MARKYGKINQMATKFEDYSYIINGVGGIGKTCLVYEIGKLVTGSDEGTFIITCGGENPPRHIPNAFGDIAHDYKTFVDIVKELCENKDEYAKTKFVAIDSLDEYARITENAVISEWNKQCDISERAKSIKQAYKGFQGGENRACELMIAPIMKLQAAGYSILEIGHTKEKDKESAVSGIKYKQLTCNLDNKYYALLKDKVNLIAMCYFEDIIENVEERKNAFTKKMEKVGNIVKTQRVMVFNDDEKKSIDTKTHFEYIEPKIEFGAANFIQAVETAIQKKLEVTGANDGIIHPISVAKLAKFEEPIESDNDVEEDSIPWEDETASAPADNNTESDTEEEIDDIFDESIDSNFDEEDVKARINAAFKGSSAEVKKTVRGLLNGNKLADIHDEATLSAILEALA